MAQNFFTTSHTQKRRERERENSDKLFFYLLFSFTLIAQDSELFFLPAARKIKEHASSGEITFFFRETAGRQKIVWIFTSSFFFSSLLQKTSDKEEALETNEDNDREPFSPRWECWDRARAFLLQSQHLKENIRADGIFFFPRVACVTRPSISRY